MCLVHIMAGYWSLQVAKLLHWQTSGALFVQAVTSTLLTIVVARLSWQFLEKALLVWKDKRFSSSSHPTESTMS